jgi:hypothetical protein
MSLIGQLRFEGAASENPEDVVAAFIDGVCVGRASPVYYPQYDATLVTLDIYGSAEQAGRTVTFKAWNAGTGTLYPVVSTGSTAVTFGANRLVGSVAAPLMLDGEGKVEQQVALAKGWSWVSLNIIPESQDVGDIFSSVQPSVALVKGKTSFSVPHGGGWSGDLQAVEIGKMYKVSMQAARTLVLAGDPVDPQVTPVAISPGWSWVGYTPQVSLPLADALAGLEASEGDIIKGQSKFAIYTSGSWMGSLATLAPGSGYLYYSTATSTRELRYPSISVAEAGASFPAGFRSLPKGLPAAPAASTQWTPVGEAQYSGNMTLVAIVKEGDRTLTRSEVGVFVGSECRGAQVSTADGLLFITVLGDDSPAQLTFKVYDPASGATVSAAQALAYADDAAYGTVSAPYVISLPAVDAPDTPDATSAARLAAAGIRAYPTVVSGAFHVEAGKANLRRIAVYSMGGGVARHPAEVAARAATLDLSSLPQGAYLVVVETEDGDVYTVKILVEG